MPTPNPLAADGNPPADPSVAEQALERPEHESEAFDAPPTENELPESFPSTGTDNS